jgi:hypothetical protein
MPHFTREYLLDLTTVSLAEKQERRWTNLVRAVSTLDELAVCLPNYEQVLPASSCEILPLDFEGLWVRDN